MSKKKILFYYKLFFAGGTEHSILKLVRKLYKDFDIYVAYDEEESVDIVLKDTAIAHQPYRATFQQESLDEILRLLRLTAPIQYKYSNRDRGTDNHYRKQKIEVYKTKK